MSNQSKPLSLNRKLARATSKLQGLDENNRALTRAIVTHAAYRQAVGELNPVFMQKVLALLAPDMAQGMTGGRLFELASGAADLVLEEEKDIPALQRDVVTPNDMPQENDPSE